MHKILFAIPISKDIHEMITPSYRKCSMCADEYYELVILSIYESTTNNRRIEDTLLQWIESKNPWMYSIEPTVLSELKSAVHICLEHMEETLPAISTSLNRLPEPKQFDIYYQKHRLDVLVAI